MEINDLTIHNLSDLKEALLRLESSGLGILFVVNDEQKLVGVLTDGDIRRVLIGGALMHHFRLRLIIFRYFTVLLKK